MRQSAPVYSLVADALSSLPKEPQPTNRSERNVSQNFASLDFQASYALFSSATSANFVGPPGAAFSPVLAAFALFASAFSMQAVQTKAAAADTTKYLISAIHGCLKKWL